MTALVAAVLPVFGAIALPSAAVAAPPGGGGAPFAWIAEPGNRAPDAPADLATVPAAPCGTNDDPTRLGAGDHRFSARLSDPDGDLVDGFLNFWGANAHHSEAGRTGYVASGTTVTWTVGAGTLDPDVVYGYDARASDSKGASGPASARCYMVIDAIQPDKEPTVVSTDYPDDPDRFYGSPGQAGAFTFGNNGVTDVTGFLYSTQDPPSTWVAAENGSVTVNVTPAVPGLNTLYVRSVDAAGNPGPIARYRFNVRPARGPAGLWSVARF